MGCVLFYTDITPHLLPVASISLPWVATHGVSSFVVSGGLLASKMLVQCTALVQQQVVAAAVVWGVRVHGAPTCAIAQPACMA